VTANRPTQAEAIEAAGDVFARSLESVYGLDGTTVDQAADAALTSGGPSRDDLIARITRRRIDAGLITDRATDRAAS
jgi:hypothetical protein